MNNLKIVVLVWGMLQFFSACQTTDLQVNETESFSVESDSVTFAIIGDFGEEGNPALKVSEMVKSWHPEFVVTLGDNNYDRGELSNIENNISQYYCDFIYNPDAPDNLRCQGGAADEKFNKFFPTIGNHDGNSWQNIEPYLAYFSLPNKEVYYDFQWGAVHFFSIYSGNKGEADCCESEQAVWLKEKLATSTRPFKLVYFHHPPHSNGRHGSHESLQWDFEEWGASLVLSGHEHNYQRIVKKDNPDFPYLINGLGGKSGFYGCEENPLDSTLFDSYCFNQDYGAMKATATYDQLIIQFFTIGDPDNPIDEVVLQY